MKNYIPTIEELRRTPTPELHAMFRKAAEIAAREAEPGDEVAAEVAAARRTTENIRRCLPRPPGC